MNNKQQFIKGGYTLSFLLILIGLSFPLSARETAGKKITLSFSNLPLKEAIRKVETVSGYTFFTMSRRSTSRKRSASPPPTSRWRMPFPLY